MTNSVETESRTLSDWAAGYHTAWERHLHRAEAHKRASGDELSYDERRKQVERYIQRFPNEAHSIVCCEVCQERLEERNDQSGNMWECPANIREMLENFGFDLAKARRKLK